MAIRDTNATTAFDGFLEPVDDGEPKTRREHFRKQSKQKKSSGAPATTDAIEFRPRLGRPISVLMVLDDNQRTGDKIRVRRSRFRIGRAEGATPFGRQSHGGPLEHFAVPRQSRNRCLHILLRNTHRSDHPWSPLSAPAAARKSWGVAHGHSALQLRPTNTPTRCGEADPLRDSGAMLRIRGYAKCV